MPTGSRALPTLGKSWGIGAGTTTRTDPIAESVRYTRFLYITPVPHPSRNRRLQPKTPASCEGAFGSGAKPEQTLLVNGGKVISSSCSFAANSARFPEHPSGRFAPIAEIHAARCRPPIRCHDHGRHSRNIRCVIPASRSRPVSAACLYAGL
jgi:hypothetical protein